MPLFEYGLVLWITSKYSLATGKLIDALLTKFLKRYLGVPYNTSNAIIYHITKLKPFTRLLQELCNERTSGIAFASVLDGMQLSLFNKLPDINEYDEEEEIFKKIPSHFWRSKQIMSLPMNETYRRKICREICDSDHFEHCKLTKFHNYSTDCICKYCGDHLHPYHVTYDFCKVYSDQD